MNQIMYQNTKQQELNQKVTTQETCLKDEVTRLNRELSDIRK